MEIQEALTFDDVLLRPAASEVIPTQVNLKSRITKTIELGIPLMSAGDGYGDRNIAWRSPWRNWAASA